MTSDKWDFAAMLREFPDANPPASLASIQQVEKEYGQPLPNDYVQFLLCANGGCGQIGNRLDNHRYIDLWRIEDILVSNKRCGFDEYVPGFLAFGSNGGGETFGFDARGAEMPIFVVPYINDGWDDAIPIAQDFYSFLRIYPGWEILGTTDLTKPDNAG